VAAAEVEVLLQTCVACHSGSGVPLNCDVPIIAGQPFTVINDALIPFATGERPSTSMCAMAGVLSVPLPLRFLFTATDQNQALHESDLSRLARQNEMQQSKNLLRALKSSEV